MKTFYVDLTKERKKIGNVNAACHDARVLRLYSTERVGSVKRKGVTAGSIPAERSERKTCTMCT